MSSEERTLRAERYQHLYVIGLTGNIGCGKSAVVAMLAKLGAAVCDADHITRQVMAVGQPAYSAIVQTFGPDVLQSANGPLDRPALGRIVFGDPTKLQQLEAIVHPATRMAIHTWLTELDREAAGRGERSIAVVDAIKLIESGWPRFCDAVWVVRCEPAEQLRRLVELRGMPRADAEQRVTAQTPQDAKIAVASVVIDNSGTLDETRQQVQTAWEAIGVGR